MLQKRGYIRSSEISQYNFCSLAWYWNKVGIELETKEKNQGIEKHIELGKSIDLYKNFKKASNLFLIISIVSFIFLMIWILFLLL